MKSVKLVDMIAYVNAESHGANYKMLEHFLMQCGMYAGHTELDTGLHTYNVHPKLLERKTKADKVDEQD